MFAKSIRWRFVLWLAFLLTFILTGFGITAYQLHRKNRFDQFDDELKRRVAALSATRRAPPPPGDRGRSPGPPPEEGFDGSRPPRRGPLPESEPPRDDSRERDLHISSEVAALFDERATNGFYFAVWSRGGGALLKRSANAPTDTPRPEQPGKDTGTYFRTRGAFREAFHYTERGDGILAGRSIVSELDATRRFALWLVAGGVAVLAVGLGGVWLLAGRALKPVEEISAAATRIAAGNLAERINVADTDNELGQLASTLNSTFARLESAFAQQKQFTGDASHELRTPLSVMISEAQTTLARERTAAEYRETVEACLDTAQQMRQLTESLLELARFDAGQNPLARAPLDLAEATRACVALIHPLANPRGIRLVLNLAPAAARGDAELLNRVITNLLTNAIHYNRPKGEVRVTTSSENGAAVLTVADTGPGLAPEDLPHIFERFFRADKSRSRATGRAGLGLAICKAILDAHGGSIEVSSQPHKGAVFTVRLPMLA